MSSLKSIANELIVKDLKRIEPVKKNFTTQDIINAILLVDKEATSAESVKEFAPYLAGSDDYETLYNIWYFVRNQIKYIPDGFWYEDVKSPASLWGTGYGDCKSMSIFVASIIRHFPQFSIKYRFASYPDSDRNPDDYSHVYVVAKSRGREVIVDSVHTRFDDEVEYLKKKDFLVRELRIIRGIPTAIHATAPNVVTKKAVPTKIEAYNDGPKQVAVLNNLPIDKLSQGELKLRLLDQQLDILIAYYADPTGKFKTAKNILHNAIIYGIQNFSPNGIIDSSLYPIYAQIEKAKSNLKKPILIQDPSIGEDPSIRLQYERRCVEKFKPEEKSKLWKFFNGSGSYIIIDDKIYKKEPGQFYDCIKAAYAANYHKEKYFDSLDFERGAHHMLYEFMDLKKFESKISAFGASKVNKHRQAVSAMSEFSSLDRENVELYTRNAIMKNSARIKVPDISPEGNIGFLSLIPELNEPRVGISPEWAGILKTLITALVASAPSLISAFKSSAGRFRDQVANVGTPEFGPEDSDWKQLQSLKTTNLMLSGVAAAAGAYLIFSKD